MPSPLAAFGLAALLAAPAAEGPALVAHADGSWTVARELREQPLPRLELATDALVIDEDPLRPAVAPLRYDDALYDELRLRRGDHRDRDELEREAEDAFEEAIDAARSDERPD